MADWPPPESTVLVCVPTVAPAVSIVATEPAALTDAIFEPAVMRVPATVRPTSACENVPAELKPILARQMAVYAGFLEHTDHQIGRLVDAIDDLGVRRGAQRLDGLADAPAPKALLARGEDWAPYRTLASLYLWRIADGEGVVEPARKPA